MLPYFIQETMVISGLVFLFILLYKSVEYGGGYCEHMISETNQQIRCYNQNINRSLCWPLITMVEIQDNVYAFKN